MAHAIFFRVRLHLKDFLIFAMHFIRFGFTIIAVAYTCWESGPPQNISWPVRTARMCSREKLCTLGFPVTASQARSMGVPILGIKDVARCAQIAGNCMNFSVVCLIQLIALSCFKMKWDRTAQRSFQKKKWWIPPWVFQCRRNSIIIEYSNVTLPMLKSVHIRFWQRGHRNVQMGIRWEPTTLIRGLLSHPLTEESTNW